MKIDLNVDSKEVFKFIRQRIADYPHWVNQGPGEDEDPISLITLGYQISQAGWIALVFDTRPNASPDGEWQSYIEENSLEMPHWFEAVDSLYENDESIELILTNGKIAIIDDQDELVESVGKTLKDLMIKARKEKLFSELPIASKSCMSVEDHDGMYGWPNYEKRYTQGRVI